jgi:DNA polymerase elongation subunit (family B)
LNSTYDKFSKVFLNCDTHRFDIKQELIARAAFWVTKKRYGQWIINDAGVKCDKLDVKGLDIVRSNFPKAFRELMTSVLKDILSNKDKDLIDRMILDFKKDMKSVDLSEIALPTGVKRLSKFKDTRHGKFGAGTIFTPMYKGTPVHVKAAWIYNDLLKYYELDNYEKIKNSEKIKWVYLKSNNPLQISQIAFKGYDDPPEIMKYIEDHVDRDKIFNKALKKKLDLFYESMDWVLVDKQDSLERFF